MNKKQKIILVISSASLGLAIILAPFLGKDSSPKKVENQYQVNNYPAEKENSQPEQKEKSSSTFGKVIKIIGIIILIIVIIWITYLIIYQCRRHKYLSGKCYLRCAEGHVYIFFCPNGQPEEVVQEQLYNLDIQSKVGTVESEELKTLYKNLETNSQLFIDFGKLIDDFFNEIDGYLLEAVDKFHNDNGPIHINIPRATIHGHLESEGFTKNDFKIYSTETDFTKNKLDKIIPENALLLFKIALNNKDAVFEHQNTVLFPHYFTAYSLMLTMFETLTNFFIQKGNEKYQKKYQNKINIAKQNIDDLVATLSKPKTN